MKYLLTQVEVGKSKELCLVFEHSTANAHTKEIFLFMLQIARFDGFFFLFLFQRV